ncbi:MAG: hypothetical protein OXB86_01140 [Bdellovibrionales bacterium]|nr:hypothetical protein [Bdellovibrionales bacterium]
MAEKKEFYFLGKAPLSKSLLNRALIIRGWFPDFDIQGTSSCDDIQIMTKALENPSAKIINCGLSASAFRFLALYLSRKGGEYFLTGQPALLNRQMQELPMILSQLGVSAIKEEKGWQISSEGWKPQGDYVNIPYKTTSQYASGLLLSGWNLKRDLFFALNRNQVSFAHFKMTLDFVQQLGMDVKSEGTEYCIPAGQTLQVFHYKPEQDRNSLFALAALAALTGKAVFSDWTDLSLQSEAVFPHILEKMGVSLKKENHTLSVFKTDHLKPLEMNLCSTPDLFPVLSVLCAKANGTSRLSGLKHLAFKESHRLNQMEKLFQLSNIAVEKTEDTFTIHGNTLRLSVKPFEFDGAGDHRIIMAAALLKKIGVPIQITGKEAVSKSFPDFFKYIGPV